MDTKKSLEKQLEELGQAVRGDDAFVANVMARINAAEPGRIKQNNKLFFRSFIMNRFTKFAAAAVIIIAVVFSINILDKSVPTAYALEQTIQANHTVRYIHVKAFEPSHEEPTEFWVEFDDYGSIKNLRGEIPAWMDKYGDDGAKSVVWKDNKAQIWLPKKNIFVTIKDKSVATHVLMLLQELDPKLAVERLNKKSSSGNAKVEISEPSNMSEPIVVTATSLQNEALNESFLQKSAAANKTDEPGAAAASVDPNAFCRRAVLFIDQGTKLVTSIELYRLTNGDYQKMGTIKYFDYNQPIDTSIFAIDVPAGAMIIDQTAQEVGLLQGQLTDKEVAVEVVRQFVQALISRDFAKAGQLYEGLPATKMEGLFGNTKYLRLVSIDELTPSIITGGYKVPCVIEKEENGKVTQWSPYGPFVRQVHGQPGRWTICGGW